MSDSGNDAGTTATPGSGPAFSEREMQMLAWAMQSLRSGPPDIDYEKLAKYAGMSNHRSASNAWAKIRNKLNATTGDGGLVASKKTPQKKVTAGKAGKAASDAADDAETPKKTPRKRTPKKQEVDGEEASPKKRGRSTKAKKAADEDSATVKTEESVDEKMDDASADSKTEDETTEPEAEAVQKEI